MALRAGRIIIPEPADPCELQYWEIYLTSVEPVHIPFGDGTLSGLLSRPSRALACYVLAHGAGAGMSHAFLEEVATALGERRVATLRFQFPFMEQGKRRPDPPPVAESAVRAAVDSAAEIMPGLPLFAGGKSFGGRMSSQAQAESPFPNVRGLVFIGFPLHPAKRPSIVRAQHLTGVHVPMLFLQGTRDDLADLTLLEPVIAGLTERATLHTVDDADHAFHVRARSGRNDAAVRGEISDAIANWIRSLI